MCYTEPMERKKSAGPKVKMMSFRFSKETTRLLEALAKYYGRGNTEVIEGLIEEEASRLEVKDRKEFSKFKK